MNTHEKSNIRVMCLGCGAKAKGPSLEEAWERVSHDGGRHRSEHMDWYLARQENEAIRVG